MSASTAKDGGSAEIARASFCRPIADIKIKLVIIYVAPKSSSE